MKRRIGASMTVEAALLYPYMLLVMFLLVKLTVFQYAVVREEAAGLYDAVFTERKLSGSELVRLSELAFDLFEK